MKYTRIEDIQRTICSCDKCSKFCKIMPGYLTPQDIPILFDFIRIITKKYIPAIEIYSVYLRASPGAIVIKNSKMIRIPTIVPATINGICVFYSKPICRIHEVAPFACRVFDEHISNDEADERSQFGLHEIEKSKGYFQLWTSLKELGLTTLPPEVLRRRLSNVR